MPRPEQLISAVRDRPQLLIICRLQLFDCLRQSPGHPGSGDSKHLSCLFPLGTFAVRPDGFLHFTGPRRCRRIELGGRPPALPVARPSRVRMIVTSRSNSEISDNMP